MNTPLRRSHMARGLKGSHSFTCTPRIHPLTGMNHTTINYISVWCSHHESHWKSSPTSFDEWKTGCWLLEQANRLQLVCYQRLHPPSPSYIIQWESQCPSQSRKLNRAKHWVNLSTAAPACNLYPRRHIVAAFTMYTQGDVQSWDLMDCSHIHTYIIFIECSCHTGQNMCSNFIETMKSVITYSHTFLYFIYLSYFNQEKFSTQFHRKKVTKHTHLECWRSAENGMDATSIVISVLNKPSDQRSRWRRPRPVDTSSSSRKHTRLQKPPPQPLFIITMDQKFILPILTQKADYKRSELQPVICF